MANKEVALNQDNVSVRIRVLDDSDGTPKTDLVDATSGHEIWYQRDENTASATDGGSAADMTNLTDPHVDWEFKHIREGWYRVDLPDAAFAEGVTSVLCGMNATDFTGISVTVDINPRWKFQGLASSVTASTTTFEANTTPYKGDIIRTLQGLGDRQTRIITSVAGEVATHLAWTVNIDNTTSIIRLETGDPTFADAAVNTDVLLSTRATPTQVKTQVDTALTDIDLDHLISASVTGADVADDSIIATMVSSSGTSDWDTFDNTTESLQALKDITNTTLLLTTTVNVKSTEQVFTIVDGSSTNDTYQDMLVVISDVGNPENVGTGTMQIYDGATKGISLVLGLNGYSFSNGDVVKIYAISPRLEDIYQKIDNTGVVLASSEITAIWETALIEDYAADGAQGNASQILYAIQQFLYDADISGTAMTIRKLDGTTQSAIITLDNATTPTDKNRTA